jgi:hypothetical protein
VTDERLFKHSSSSVFCNNNNNNNKVHPQRLLVTTPNNVIMITIRALAIVLALSSQVMSMCLDNTTYTFERPDGKKKGCTYILNEKNETVQSLRIDKFCTNITVSNHCPMSCGACTSSPSDQPSITPSAFPTELPSSLPSSSPSTTPSSGPSALLSLTPSAPPSDIPSTLPSLKPSKSPSSSPSDDPSALPSSSPSIKPSLSQKPTSRFSPSSSPSSVPSPVPSLEPPDRTVPLLVIGGSMVAALSGICFGCFRNKRKSTGKAYEDIGFPVPPLPEDDEEEIFIQRTS